MLSAPKNAASRDGVRWAAGDRELGLQPSRTFAELGGSSLGILKFFFFFLMVVFYFWFSVFFLFSFFFSIFGFLFPEVFFRVFSNRRFQGFSLGSRSLWLVFFNARFAGFVLLQVFRLLHFICYSVFLVGLILSLLLVYFFT